MILNVSGPLEFSFKSDYCICVIIIYIRVFVFFS